MSWLLNLDLAGFRFINQTLSNPVSDVVMPLISGNLVVNVVLALLAVWLLWRGGAKGRCFILLIVLSVAATDGLLANQLKHAISRPRPIEAIPDAHMLAGRGRAKSMPSAHAANTMAATMVAMLFYRRTRWVLLPVVAAVGFSRVAMGAHYPSDVLAGWLVGLIGGWGFPRLLNQLWRLLGRWFFPVWHARLPNLFPDANGTMLLQPTNPATRPEMRDRQWWCLGYLFIGVLLAVRLAYVKSGVIQLSEDEAYQWLWSKHPALSYYSKPPFIAYAQWIGTHLFGDTQLGVRCFAPAIAAALGVLLLRFVAEHLGPRAGVLLLVGIVAVPLLSVGSTLMTVDPLTVLFWTGAMVAGWRAIQRGWLGDWLVVGLCFAGGFLSKFISPLQWLSFALFFVLWPRARACLKTPGPWLALGLNLLATVPVILWNQQHGWITATHLSERGGLDKAWHPTLKYFFEFLGAELGLLNPLFFIALVAALVLFWRQDWKQRAQRPEAVGLRLYLFCHGAIVMGFYLLYTFKARVQPNWIATSVVPLLLFTLFVLHDRWGAGQAWPRRLLQIGVFLGLPLVILLHDTRFIGRATGFYLPAKADPLMRVRGYDEFVKLVKTQRDQLLTEGKPVFVITDHYGLCGLLNFYWPEAKPRVTTDPLVTVLRAERPHNQIWFWPHYRYDQRQGQTALYVQDPKWGDALLPQLRQEFATVTDLGTFETSYGNQVAHRYQLFACRDKR